MHESEPAVALPAEARPSDSPDGVPAPQPIPLTDKVVLYGMAMTYAEYVQSSPHLDFLEMRAREIRLLPEEQLFFTEYTDAVHWLVVIDESPDTLVVLPVVAHVAAWAPRISLRLVTDDEADRLLSALVEDDTLLAQWAEAPLPLLLSFDEDWNFQEAWGPHPQAMESYLEPWLAAHAEYDRLAEDDSRDGQRAYARLQTRLLHEMRMWYNSALNHATAVELRALLARWRVEAEDGNGDDGSRDEDARSSVSSSVNSG